MELAFATIHQGNESQLSARPLSGGQVEEADGSIRFVLKDGTEIHRIAPPTEVYDYDTGKLVGRVGPTGRFVPLAVNP